jgi:hypothetical protein
VIVIQTLLLVALQPHSGVVVIETVPPPPAMPKGVEEEKVNPQVEIIAINASSLPPP